MIDIKTPEMILEERVASLEAKLHALEIDVCRIGDKVYTAEITRAELGVRVNRIEQEIKTQEVKRTC